MWFGQQRCAIRRMLTIYLRIYRLTEIREPPGVLIAGGRAISAPCTDFNSAYPRLVNRHGLD